MEHQVFVPVPVPALRSTLGDPLRVARCVPGLQQDADASASPLAGRWKFRAGGHTITYRGELKLSGPEDGRFSVTGEGVEARGTGAVKLALTIALTETDGGTTLTYSGTASGDGRLVELEEGAALAAAHRLLDRFTQQLVTETLATHEGAEGAERAEEAVGAAGADTDAHAGDAADVTDAPDVTDEGLEGEGLEGDVEAAADASGPGSDSGPGDPGSDPAPGSVFDSPVPPPALDPVAGVEFTVPDEPPAEAAHARRTMIGRSAEEVDHAPPRGRYAPVPSPDAGGAGSTLRWVAPAAALALASAVVISRALRRRK
ncbi:SRPBCC domain-containing protein [Streptomyces griseus]|uniref:SRPBCC domain-containing protein n=1 Tax=Streptomyces stephensoniae TaxID=3375367 RepID=A0ABU2W3U5_9ACTN|nr:SRPBCC domain-containing protein [Streptomyces griseus]MDT0492530.1 SRPBCC domain-containing protein [Streptomyces griseus]